MPESGLCQGNYADRILPIEFMWQTLRLTKREGVNYKRWNADWSKERGQLYAVSLSQQKSMSYVFSLLLINMKHNHTFRENAEAKLTIEKGTQLWNSTGINRKATKTVPSNFRIYWSVFWNRSGVTPKTADSRIYLFASKRARQMVPSEFYAAWSHSGSFPGN